MEEKPNDNIEEIKELLKGFELILLTYAKIMKDGKIGFKDLPHLFDAFSQLGVIIEAIEGIGSIPEDIKEMSSIEALEIGRELHRIVAKFKRELQNEAEKK